MHQTHDPFDGPPANRLLPPAVEPAPSIEVGIPVKAPYFNAVIVFEPVVRLQFGASCTPVAVVAPAPFSASKLNSQPPPASGS